jgi:beta-barrel assembly-enhancing protease
MRYRLVAITMLLACFAGLGCAPRATLPAIGPGTSPQLTEREMRLWQISREFADQLDAGGAAYREESVREYVQSVLKKLLAGDPGAYAPLELSVHIVDQPSLNAFCLPNGCIAIHTGILGRMRNEAQLAMLLAHEITHATHRHTYQQREDLYSRTAGNAYVCLLSAAGGAAGAAISQVSTLVTTAAISGYSREQETEADRIGLELLVRAGYDSERGAQVFQRLLDAADKNEKQYSFVYSNHPQLQERVADCRALVSRFDPGLRARSRELGEQAYVNVMKTLIYQEVMRHIAQGKFDLAVETLQTMSRLRPADAEARCLLGDLYRARGQDGDKQRCRDAYGQALAVDSHHPPTHRNLGLLLMEQGDVHNAAQHLKQFLDDAPSASDAAYIRQCLDQLNKKGAQQ